MSKSQILLIFPHILTQMTPWLSKSLNFLFWRKSKQIQIFCLMIQNLHQILQFFWFFWTGNHKSRKTILSFCCNLFQVDHFSVLDWLDYFSEHCPNTDLFLVRIFPHSDWMRRDTKYEVSLRIQSECGKIRTRNNSVFGHFSHSVSINSQNIGLAAWKTSFHVMLRALISIHLFFCGQVVRYSTCYSMRIVKVLTLVKIFLLHNV